MVSRRQRPQARVDSQEGFAMYWVRLVENDLLWLRAYGQATHIDSDSPEPPRAWFRGSYASTI